MAGSLTEKLPRRVEFENITNPRHAATILLFSRLQLLVSHDRETVALLWMT